jgi:gluconolactonase
MQMPYRAPGVIAFIAAGTILMSAVPSAQNPPANAGPQTGPDSQVQAGTPTGEVIKGEFAESRIYPGTWREYWVYVPKQLDRSKPAPVMVFQDGLQYNAPVVFDNLINRKEIPPLVGVFVMHGRVKAPSSDALDRMNRSVEYDSVSGDYAAFLLDELLPFVAKTHGLTLSTDPNDRAIAGNSSGAIAAFAAAWQRPDAFRRVFSAIGTYVGLRGGNELPVMIRKTEPKPIRVFLQDGRNDLNNYTGSWFVANQDMLSALEFAGYDVRHDWGDGEHNSRHATAIFPEVVRWLWRDYPAPITANPDGRSKQDVFQAVIPGEEWHLVTDKPVHGAGVASNTEGDVFFEDTNENRLYKVALDGSVTPLANTKLVRALTFGPDGQLYAAAPRSGEIAAYDPLGKSHIVARAVSAIDLAINVKGDLYFTDGAGHVWLLPKGGKPRVVEDGISAPVGVLLSPDQTLLYVSDKDAQLSWAFQIQPDGSLAHKQRYFYVHVPDPVAESGAAGMAVDTLGSVYMATALGVQVFDQIGKCHAILPSPVRASVTNVTFGGADLHDLFIVTDHRLYKRKTKVTGVQSWKAPIKPPQPRL